MALLKVEFIFRNRWTTTIRHAESLARATTTTGTKEDVPLDRQATTGKSVTNYKSHMNKSHVKQKKPRLETGKIALS